MEQDIKQHVITPLKGICNTPSDLTCDDEQLAVCEGMVNVNGELMPVQKPKVFGETMSIDGKLLYVHNYNDNKRYIFLKEGTGLRYIEEGTPSVSKTLWNTTITIKKIESVGNTLAVNTSDGVYYFVWKLGAYKNLGNSIPKPQYEVTTEANTECVKASTSTTRMAYGTRPLLGTNGRVVSFKVEDASKEKFENAYMGVYAQAKNELNKKRLFSLPFFARIALEMYDGSYLYISNPIMVHIPIDRPMYWICNHSDSDINSIEINLFGCSLKVKQGTNYSEYSDIISNISIFITKPTEMFEEMREQIESTTDYWWYSQAYHEYLHQEGIAGHTEWNPMVGIMTDNGKKKTVFSFAGEPGDESEGGSACRYQLLKRKSDTDILNEMNDSMQFFKICDFKVTEVGKWVNTKDLISDTCIQNISTQARLDHDDYFGWTRKMPEDISCFNSRLCMSGVRRDFFDGFYQHSVLKKSATTRTIVVNVKIESDDGVRWVSKTANTDLAFNDHTWFFYPDTRATQVNIFSNGTLVFSNTLQKHKQLNGAYYMPTSFPSSDGVYDSDDYITGTETIQSHTTDTEIVNDYILQSEVNNLWVFNASSYFKVGNGKVIGIAALTTALSNNAYKVSTTLCFTTQGIWALLSNSEGMYVNVPPAFSREVCTDANSITMVDNGVFFTSAKGLMFVSGTNEGSVQCVSNQLSGKGKSDFLSFLNGCKMAYDYRSRKIILFRTDTSKVWVYDLASATFSTKQNYLDSTHKPLCVVGDYPDNIIQNANHDLYTLYNKPQRDTDTNSYSATLESRPMKLDGSSYLKSLRRVKNIMMLDSGAAHTLKLYGSNDIKNWYELPSLQGKPWRFFKYKIQFSNLKATDTFSGLLLQTQVRYTEKPR